MIYLHWTILAIYSLVIVATMVTILLDNRQPAKTMAWMLVLFFLPVAGIILYYFFGQNTRKERLISQKSIDELSKRSMWEFAEQRNLHLPESHRRLIQLYTNQSMALPFKDNEVEIYTQGADFFLSLIQEIGRAKDHIHLESFIFNDDELGHLVADCLIDKARQGIEVRVIYDDVGSWSVRNRFFERMREAGIDVQGFMPVRFPAFTSKANYRNHRKLCIIDGRIGFIGGMNIATRYVKGTSRQMWRDTHLKVEGGAVYAIQREFLIDWYFMDRTLIDEHRYYPPLNPAIKNNCLAQVVTSSPVSVWPDIMQGYVRVLLEAQHYVFMESPYFLPTEPVLFAMRTAALAGVDVRLLVPSSSDSKMVNWASRSYLADAMKAGVKVYLYTAGFNHSKLLISDDSLCTCGSTNIDFRSFEHDFESNIFFYDEAMARRMKRIFLADQQHAVLLNEQPSTGLRPFVHRFWESLIRLLSPLM